MWGYQDDDDELTERKCTNLSSLFACIAFIIITLLLVGISASKGDLHRLTNGYDDCGNVCGRINYDNNFEQCGTHDKRNLSKTLVTLHDYGKQKIPHYICVESCPKNYEEIFNRCFLKGGNVTNKLRLRDVFQEISEDLIVSLPKIALVCLITLVISFNLLVLFRFAIKYIIWIIYLSFIAVMTVGSVVLWYRASKIQHGGFSHQKACAALLTMIDVIAIFVLCWYQRRIRLVAELFKEASKALIDIPSLLIEPILTFASLLVAFVPFVYLMIVLQSAGKLTKGETLDGQFQATFKKDFLIKFAQTLNYIAFFWFTQFIFGCQHFVIAGTISKWYFSRDKTKLYSPIITTFSHLWFYHLGSICMGSVMITLVKILKMVVDAIKNQLDKTDSTIGQCLSCCCSCIIETLDSILRYFIRNAYIIVAKDGTPFMVSARRAYELLMRDIVDVIALNQLGDFVLVLARLFIVGIAGFIGYELMNKSHINYVYAPLLLSIIFAFLIAHCFISVFEMTVDTIFICFSEDIEGNDGVTRPYYMSLELRNIMCEMKESAGGQFKSFNTGNRTEHHHLLSYTQMPMSYHAI